MTEKHDQRICNDSARCGECNLCKMMPIIEKHNAEIIAERKSAWQEMREEMADTLRDLHEFANRNTTFSVFVAWPIFLIALLSIMGYF